jgi:hypothetical protein
VNKNRSIRYTLTGPGTRRVVGQLAERFDDWWTGHRTRTEERDRDEEEVWLMHRRHKLCADLRRVEHLLATDMWMSATRQLGNRLAYQQLLDELRRTPDVFPTIPQLQRFDSYDEPTVEPRSWGLASHGLSGQPRTVEILEIRWDRGGTDAGPRRAGRYGRPRAGRPSSADADSKGAY